MRAHGACYIRSRTTSSNWPVAGCGISTWPIEQLRLFDSRPDACEGDCAQVRSPESGRFCERLDRLRTDPRTASLACKVLRLDFVTHRAPPAREAARDDGASESARRRMTSEASLHSLRIASASTNWARNKRAMLGLAALEFAVLAVTDDLPCVLMARPMRWRAHFNARAPVRIFESSSHGRSSDAWASHRGCRAPLCRSQSSCVTERRAVVGGAHCAAP